MKELFFVSEPPQERQNIIKYWLDNLRAKPGEVLHNIHFLEGQPISTCSLCALMWSALPKIDPQCLKFKVISMHIISVAVKFFICQREN